MTYVIERKTSVTRRTRPLIPAPRFGMSESPRERKTDMSEPTNTPTVVLVHGGFADASFWAPVIEDLQAHDVPVLAPPNPLRGLAHDAEYVASYVNQIDGPVLLVGHSYGGAVISVAGASTPNAVGLVYVAAFALDEGESFAEIFEDRAEAAAWKTLPSWAVVASSDNAIPPDAERHMAQRAGAQTIEVDASHSIALSQAKAVADLIQTAINSTTRIPVGA